MFSTVSLSWTWDKNCNKLRDIFQIEYKCQAASDIRCKLNSYIHWQSPPLNCLNFVVKHFPRQCKYFCQTVFRQQKTQTLVFRTIDVRKQLQKDWQNNKADPERQLACKLDVPIHLFHICVSVNILQSETTLLSKGLKLFYCLFGLQGSIWSINFTFFGSGKSSGWVIM